MHGGHHDITPDENGLGASRGIMFGLAVMLPIYAAAALALMLLLR